MAELDPEVMSTPPVSRPAPASLEEAMRRLNTTTADARKLAMRAKGGFVPGSDTPYEYDQGDTLTVHYDDLYDLADIALAAIDQAQRGEWPVDLGAVIIDVADLRRVVYRREFPEREWKAARTRLRTQLIGQEGRKE